MPKLSGPALLRSHINAPSEIMIISRKITKTEAAKTGIGSKTQKMTAKAKMANNRRSTIVMPSIGITSNGRKSMTHGNAMPKKRLNILFTETILSLNKAVLCNKFFILKLTFKNVKILIRQDYRFICGKK